MSAAPGAERRATALWRAARVPVALGLLVVLTGVVVGLARGGGPAGLLDPAAVDAAGSRAVAELLRDGGVDVRTTADPGQVAAAGRGTTLLVALPDELGPRERAAVRSADADVVLVVPTAALDELAPGVELAAVTEDERLAPRCDLPAVRAAGDADVGGLLYRAPRGTACYPGADGAALVRLDGAARSVTVLGAAAPLTNGTLGEAGNAALALGVLGAHRELLWYLPGPPAPADGEQRSLAELVPAGWWWGAGQLALAVVLAALWRGRRLGPVVVERLPAVVRAAETVEGRARLYERARDRGHAAAVLRAAAARRLRPLLGLPRDAPARAVAAAAAGRTGRPGRAVADLLDGPAPGDDAGLVRVAADLDALEQEVLRS